MKKSLLLVTSIFLLLPACKNEDNSNQISEQLVQSQNVKAQYKSYQGQKLVKSKNTNSSKCRTTPDILGPFYRTNAPFTNNVRQNNEPGESLIVKGIVYGKDCVTPVKGALVEIWQADNKGKYDNDSQKFLYRARLITDEKGRYELKTIIPREYDIGENRFRPEHLHFKVTAAGHEELVTQTYFKNDPNIPSDPWASKPEAKARILEMKKKNQLRTLEIKKVDTGENQVEFLIYL